jgi:hypothetical protein
MRKSIIVIDDFYINVDEVRQFALSVEYQPNLKFYKGLRSVKNYQQDGIKEVFETLIGEKIKSFPNEGSTNGCFQITTAEDPQVYHCDLQKWAAMIYLTPNAPLQSGTRTHKSKINNAVHGSDVNISQSFIGGHYDSTKFDIVDDISNVYNRLVIMDAQQIHSAGNYFGNSKESGRLIQLFFFD